MIKILLPLLFLSTSVYAEDLIGILPDPNVTPGIIATSSWNDICNSHLSRNRNVGESVKKDSMKQYDVTKTTDYCSRLATSGSKKGQVAGCEIDHLIPLEDGGANDPKNLWPEPYGGEWNAHMKDKLENRVHKLICEKQLSDDQVKVIQRKLADDWIGFYKEQFGDK